MKLYKTKESSWYDTDTTIPDATVALLRDLKTAIDKIEIGISTKLG